MPELPRILKEKQPETIEFHLGRGIPIIIGVFIALYILFGAIAIVDAGNIGVQSTFGQVAPDTLDAGIHLKLPWVSVISMNYQVQKYDAKASAASSDLQDVSSEITVNYNLNKGQAIDVYKTNGIGYADKVIPQAVQESVKAVTAKFSAEQLITNRESVRSGIEDSLRGKLQQYGISVQAVSITNFDFSQSFNDAIEAKVTAQQKALEAENVLKQVQFEAQQKIAQAQGDANATLTNAIASAEALKIQNDALSQSQDVLKLKLIEKWNGQYPTYYWVGNEGSALVQVPGLVDTNTQSP